MNIGEKIIEIRKERKMTQEDFAKVCKELHENGIKVVLDGVFNHVGRGFQIGNMRKVIQICKQLFKSVMNLIFRWISC